MLLQNLVKASRSNISRYHIAVGARQSDHARHLSTPRLIYKNGAEKGRPSIRPSEPPLRWSNRTLIMLSSAVGASMYMLGVNQGYNAGKTAAMQAEKIPQSPYREQNASKDALSAAATAA